MGISAVPKMRRRTTALRKKRALPVGLANKPYPTPLLPFSVAPAQQEGASKETFRT